MSFFNGHNHTMFSNLRILDSIIKPKDLIDKAIELGLSGIAITDHECLSAHIEVNKYAKKIKENNPEFTIALGNEIYLTETREKNQKNYFHFILIAKDSIGHRCLRELSSIAWYNSYWDRGLERVPLLKNELKETIEKGNYKGHIIATTACLGGELPKLILAKRNNDLSYFDEKIKNFIDYCCDVFGKEDFYLECAPSTDSEQIYVNRELYEISNKFGIKLTVATDSHYLTKETRFAHKAYLNSKDGEREVDKFYEFARLMDENEVAYLLNESFSDFQIVSEIFETTEQIRKKIQFYSLERNQQIPLTSISKREAGFLGWSIPTTYPTLDRINRNGNEQEQKWLDDCMEGMKKLVPEEDIPQYINRLEIEADIIDFIGQRLGTCLFAYFNTFKHYIDLFWDCGSIVGPGRGSACGFLSNYLLGITQLNPIRWRLPYWRFLNKERAELPSLLLILGSIKNVNLI